MFLCILRFRIFKSSCSQRFKVEVVSNLLIPVYLGAQRLNVMDRHPMFCYRFGIFSKCLLFVKYDYMFSFAFLSLSCNVCEY